MILGNGLYYIIFYYSILYDMVTYCKVVIGILFQFSVHLLFSVNV